MFCIAEFVRVVTHLRVFDPPSPLATALDFLNRLQASPSLRLLLPGPDFPGLFRDVCESARVRGNLAIDTKIAAVCRQHGVHEILIGDRNFARFDSLAPRYL